MVLYFVDDKVSCNLHPKKQLKLYALTTLRGTLMEYYHDHSMSGHLGMTKIILRLRMRCYWPKLSSDAKKYVASCYQFPKLANRTMHKDQHYGLCPVCFFYCLSFILSCVLLRPYLPGRNL